MKFLSCCICMSCTCIHLDLYGCLIENSHKTECSFIIVILLSVKFSLNAKAPLVRLKDLFLYGNIALFFVASPGE